MSVDNAFYDEVADGWWDEGGPMYALHPRANPARLDYALGVLRRACPPSARVLDLGCGGGFLSEELAGRGYAVCGLDPAGRLVEAAREHARRGGLEIDYRVGAGEALPYGSASFDAVLCLDVLEHVSDLDRVVAEAARVLAPGGVFVYDTINRTWRSRLVVVHLLQDLPWTSLAPKGLHDWRAFVRPRELRAALARTASPTGRRWASARPRTSWGW